MALHLDLDSPHTSSLTTDESLSSAGQEISFNLNLKQLKKPSSSKGVSRTRILWPALSLGCLAVFLALQVMAFVCSHFKVMKKAESTVFGRRLADGGEEDDSDPLRSYSPDLELLCWAAQGWQPVDTPAGYHRLSPQAVDAFFESISPSYEGHSPSALPMPLVGPPNGSDGDLAFPRSIPSHPQQGYQPYPQQRLSPDIVQEFFTSIGAPAEMVSAHGPPFDSDDSNDSDEQRLSQIFFELKQHPQHATAGSLLTAPGPAPSVSSAPSPSGFSPVAAPPSQAPGAPSLAALWPSPAAASAVQQQEPPALSSNLHPYIRIPPLKPGVVPRPWNIVRVRGPTQHSRSNFPMLYDIHDLLLKTSLDAEDVEQLMNSVEMLANFAFHRYRKSTSYRSSAELMRARATRFIVFEALYSACQAVNQKIPSWWSAVAEAALQNLTLPVEHPGRPPSASLRLAIRLTEVLRKYRKGEAPLQEEIVALKRTLFVDPKGPVFFRYGYWQRWMEDDQKFTSGQSS